MAMFTVTRTTQALTGPNTVSVDWESTTDAQTALQAVAECLEAAQSKSTDVDIWKAETLSITITVHN